MLGLIVLVFIITAFFAIIPISNRRTTNLLFWSIGFILFLIAAFRSSLTSPDYDVYLRMYNDNTLFVEQTFIYISWFVKLVFNNSLFLFIIYAALAVFIKFKVIRITTELWLLCVITYISSVYIVQEHAQMRAGVATAFLMLTIKPLYERNGKLFLLYSFFAIIFHYSAIIILFLWFLVKPKPFKCLLWGIIPLGYAIYLLDINIISAALPFEYIHHKIRTYQALQSIGQDGFDSINVFGIGVMLKCFFFYSLLYFRNTIRKYNVYIDSLLTIYAIGIFTIPAFATMPVVSFRLSAMLVSVEMLLFPMFYYILNPKILASIIVVLIAGVNLCINLRILSL